MTILASLFNLAGPDLIIILLIVLLLFGAKKLPELARGMGQAVREFTSAKDEFEREISKPVNEVTVRKPAEQQPHASSANVAEAHPVAVAGIAPLSPDVAPLPVPAPAPDLPKV